MTTHQKIDTRLLHGGPAFPAPELGVWESGSEVYRGLYGGMTLRDYFAAKAMAAQMLNHAEMNYWGTEYSIEYMWKAAADNAYLMADAMLRAREPA